MGTIVQKECKKHGLTDFVLRNDGRYRCKKCCVEAVQKRREKVKLMAIEYKGGECQVCGYKRYQGALDFHHLQQGDKEFGLGDKGYTRSFDAIKKEVDKCLLVCSNCHREIHAGLIDVNDILNKNKKGV